MTKEDYSKYYIQNSDHYLLPKDVFDELFNEMSNWKEENQQLKEKLQQKEDIINKAIKFVKDYKTEWTLNDEVLNDMDKLLEILDNKGE